MRYYRYGSIPTCETAAGIDRRWDAELSRVTYSTHRKRSFLGADASPGGGCTGNVSQTGTGSGRRAFRCRVSDARHRVFYDRFFSTHVCIAAQMISALACPPYVAAKRESVT